MNKIYKKLPVILATTILISACSAKLDKKNVTSVEGATTRHVTTQMGEVVASAARRSNATTEAAKNLPK